VIFTAEQRGDGESGNGSEARDGSASMSCYETMYNVALPRFLSLQFLASRLVYLWLSWVLLFQGFSVDGCPRRTLPGVVTESRQFIPLTCIMTASFSKPQHLQYSILK
jgi:hypothetical protein